MVISVVTPSDTASVTLHVALPICEFVHGAHRENWLALVHRVVREAAFTERIRRNSLPEIGQRIGRFRHVVRSEEHTSELQSHSDLLCRLLLDKKIYT